MVLIRTLKSASPFSVVQSVVVVFEAEQRWSWAGGVAEEKARACMGSLWAAPLSRMWSDGLVARLVGVW